MVERIVQKFKEHNQLHILDLGAGNGSNYRFWKENLKEGAKWTFLEIDPILCKALSELGPNIEVINASITDLDKLIDLTTIDFVMANALFDLFPQAVFKDLMIKIERRKVPFYFSLNYQDMSFKPAHPHDRDVIGFYHQHMKRPQKDGSAMGAGGPKEMAEVLETIGVEFEMLDSVWEVRKTDQLMIQYLLDFMDEANHELELTELELQRLDNWLELRRNQKEKEELSISVIHQDIVGGM